MSGGMQGVVPSLPLTTRKTGGRHHTSDSSDRQECVQEELKGNVEVWGAE